MMNWKKRSFQIGLCFVIFCSSVYASENESIFKNIYHALFGKGKTVVKTVNLFQKDALVPPTCADATNLNNYSIFKGHVNVCLKLILNEEEDLVSFSEIKKCITNIGEKFKAIPTQACKDTMLTGGPGNIEKIHQFLLDGYRDDKVIVDNGTGFEFRWDNGLEEVDPNYIPYVQHYFSLVGEWYNQTRGEIYPEDSGQLVISRVQSDFLENEIMRPFWDGLQAHSPEWLDTFGQIPNALKKAKADNSVQTTKLFQIFETLLKVNQKVIGFVYKSELGLKIYNWEDNDVNPGPSPVLAMVIGDTLAPFYERIRTLTKIYDVACKLNSCDDGFYRFNETVWMLRFFDQLGQGNFVEEFNFDADDVRPLSLFIKSLYGHRIAIKDTIDKLNDVFGVTNIVNINPGSDFPHFLKSFHKVFAEGHDLVASYEATKSINANGIVKAGFFHGGNISQINVGFGKINMDRHITAVKGVNNQLEILSNSFIAQHNQLINQTISINSTQIQLSDLVDKIDIDADEILKSKLAIDTIRNFINDQRDRFGETVSHVIQNLGSSAETFTKVGGTLTVAIPANSSNQGSGNFLTVGKVLLPLPDDLVKGDLLNISVAGEYQPTCAIQSVYGAGVANAKAGPRGYALGFSSGKSDVQSTNDYSTDSDYTSSSISVDACAGVQSPLGAFGFSASLKACASFSSGSRSESGTTTSNTSSNSTRSDASFDLGLTLPNTPYSTAPVGGLLLVEMANGENNKRNYRNLKVLNTSNSIVTQYGSAESTELYLVVNDCFSTGNSGELTVTIDQYRAAGTLATNFITKVVAMMPEFETQVADLIEKGVLSQQTLASFRNFVSGSAVGGTAVSSFSGNVRTLLESFLDMQMAILDYKSQISSMERQLEMKKQNIESLIDHFSEEGQQKFLKVSQRNWNLANMDLDFVNTQGTNKNLYTLNRVVNILEHSLVSYLDFKYDEERKRAIVGDVTLLTRLNFSSPFDDISLNITTFMGTLLDNLEDDINNRPVTPKVAKGLHIPNPYYVRPIGFPEPVYHFPVMGDFRSKQFWDQVYAWKNGADGAKIIFDLKYEDLYGSRGLACYVEAPIIDSMGMFFIPENEGYITDFNNLYEHNNAKLFLDGLSYIPFENNPRQYNFTNSDWRFMDSAIRMAKSSRDGLKRLVTEFPPTAQVESGLGTGRSPFGHFQVGDIPAYYYDSIADQSLMGDTPLDEIKELFIGYTFSASNNDFNVNLDWLEQCALPSSLVAMPF